MQVSMYIGNNDIICSSKLQLVKKQKNVSLLLTHLLWLPPYFLLLPYHLLLYCLLLLQSLLLLLHLLTCLLLWLCHLHLTTLTAFSRFNVVDDITYWEMAIACFEVFRTYYIKLRRSILKCEQPWFRLSEIIQIASSSIAYRQVCMTMSDTWRGVQAGELWRCHFCVPCPFMLPHKGSRIIIGPSEAQGLWVL